MGSLTSRPKVPSVPQTQIVYMPTPVYEPYVPPPLSSGALDTPEQANPQAVAAQREQNLLTASRGRLGTITTSFRGLLSLAGTSGQRKTLLGE